jgi:hypothetical protein
MSGGFTSPISTGLRSLQNGAANRMMKAQFKRGVIRSIQRYSIHDDPGTPDSFGRDVDWGVYDARTSSCGPRGVNSFWSVRSAEDVELWCRPVRRKLGDGAERCLDRS